MKRLLPFLLLALMITTSHCIKKNQTGPDLPVEKSQLREPVSKISTALAGAEDSVKSISPIPQKFFDAVTELVKPLQEQLDAVYKDMNPSLYEAYQKDASALSKLSSDAERAKVLYNMKSRYYPFLKEGWVKAGINDAAYKEKITGLLPDDLRKLIRFDPDFLNFYFDLVRAPNATTWSLRMRDRDRIDYDEDDVPPPPVPTCTWVEGKVYYPNILGWHPYVQKFAATDAEAYGVGANGVFTHANTYPLWGRGLASMDLITNTTPDNNACAKVRVRKTTNWSASLYAFCFYGHATVSTTEYNTGYTAGYIAAVAPVIFYQERHPSSIITEQYTLYKGDAKIKFGGNSISTVASEGIFSHGSSKSNLSISSWTITDLCCNK
ncbi:hypothetical protein LQ567_00035 [Niabella pedocola]|uniref:Uncharacterized protein n=1 Tax=Niabella pedocola TaxID=1752077 RepID=A0ABS8PMW0_9BACT|nr:hypothetical protein [Niabella pedocola]MCD2421131.1 hypothetical protein [Niabella pedocola]